MKCIRRNKQNQTKLISNFLCTRLSISCYALNDNFKLVYCTINSLDTFYINENHFSVCKGTCNKFVIDTKLSNGWIKQTKRNDNYNTNKPCMKS